MTLDFRRQLSLYLSDSDTPPLNFVNAYAVMDTADAPSVRLRVLWH